MNLSGPFVRRPIATTLLAVALALFGILAFRLLPVAPLPEIDFPTILVQGQLPGADPTTVATSVTTPLERQFGHIAGLAQMTSVSSRGQTQITLQFDLSRNIDGAARDVQAAINAAKTNLSPNMDGSPTYRKVNPADSPILVISLTSDTATPAQLYDAASTVLQQKLMQTTGVGNVVVGGASLPAVRVELNPERVSHYGISLEQIRSTIGNANVDLPKGSMSASGQNYSIGANDMLYSPADYGRLIVRQNNGNIVRVSDLGYVRQDVEQLENYGLSNGKPAVLLVLYKEPGANVIDAVDNVKAELPALEAAIPSTIKLAISVDRTKTIRGSLLDVEITLLVSIVLVTAVTFAFFRSWRATLIPAIVVPLSLLGTFGVMYFLGYSLNNLSLMALTISTGFVVDDAIVVVENIMRHLARGKKPIEAALAGVQEVGFTVFSISVSLIAVFVPLLFMGGLMGRLLREFSVSLSVAIVMSMVISLTVTPMLASIFLRGGPQAGNGDDHHESGFSRLYGTSLRWVIRHPLLMGGVTVLVFVLNLWLFTVVPKGFFPEEDTGLLLGTLQASQSISWHEMQHQFQMVNKAVQENPNVAFVGGFVGGANALNNALLFVTLKPLGERRATADQVIAQVRRRLADMPGTQLYLQSLQDLAAGGRQSAAQYQYTLTADDQATLDQWVPKLVAQMHKMPALADINTDQQDKSMQVGIDVDRDSAARMGVSFKDIDEALYDAFGERQVSAIYGSANQYHVVMEVAPEYWTSPSVLKDIHVPASPALATSGASTTAAAGATGASAATPSAAAQANGSALVPLAAMARFSTGPSAISINHQATFSAITVSFNLRPGASIGPVTQQISQAVAALRMPASISGAFAGTAAAFRESMASEPLLILAALLSVYVVLGMLYENLVHPLTILSTLPSAGVGALIALLLTHTELSIIALIGVLMLIGIVKKNAIMMIDFAIAEGRQHALPPEEAIVRAGLIRFRPIMMTTVAAIFGALPLVLGSGYGSEFRKPLGISIIGGLVFSQVITLYTTPVIYLWLDRASQRLRRRRKHA
ncbi:efflux RND transporter permease subunit [Paraburkholderia phytofirmans]